MLHFQKIDTSAERSHVIAANVWLVHTNYLVIGTLSLRQRTRGIERQHSGLELSREGGVVEGEFGGTQC